MIYSIIHFFSPIFACVKTKGCPTDYNRRAEIIPCEPDAVSTAEGIVTSYLLPPVKKQLFVFTQVNSYKLIINMKLTVNNNETEAKEGCTVAQLAVQLDLPERGVAIAVNNRMIPRTNWAECVLQPNDSLVVIKAACGG